MVELYELDKIEFERQSSKGNQIKWEKDGIWYKADYCGYEGLAEYMVSWLLKYSNLNEDEFVIYNTEQIKYKSSLYNGVSSKNFLTDDWQLITLERMYKNQTGKSLYESVWHIQGIKERIDFLVSQVERYTGIKNFGEYLGKLLSIDAVFLNEDRHLHNIALLMNREGRYKLCPIFDNGASLISDTTMDYPLSEDIYKCIDSVQSKTVCSSFDDQLDAVEEMYGINIQFTFGRKEIQMLLDDEKVYSEDIKKRVEKVLLEQKRRYNYLF